MAPVEEQSDGRVQSPLRQLPSIAGEDALLRAGAHHSRLLSGVAETVSVSDNRLDDFIRLETQVWQALVDGDVDADVRMLSEDFLGIYPSGFACRNDHAAQLVDGPTVGTFQLSEARLVTVSESAVVLAYRATFTRRSGTEVRDPEAMYVGSLWCRRDDRWVNLFSQDTPALLV